VSDPRWSAGDILQDKNTGETYRVISVSQKKSYTPDPKPQAKKKPKKGKK